MKRGTVFYTADGLRCVSSDDTCQDAEGRLPLRVWFRPLMPGFKASFSPLCTAPPEAPWRTRKYEWTGKFEVAGEIALAIYREVL